MYFPPTMLLLPAQLCPRQPLSSAQARVFLRGPRTQSLDAVVQVVSGEAQGWGCRGRWGPDLQAEELLCRKGTGETQKDCSRGGNLFLN